MSSNLSSAGAPRRDPADDVPALARLCSASGAEFASEVWSRQAWLSRTEELPGDIDELFSLDAVDELLSRRALRTPFLRLARNGRVVPSTSFTGSGGVGARVADQVIDDSVLRQFADGTTLVLQGVHRTWQPVGELAAGLADELGHPVQVNSYITPPQSQGFAAHYDTHDVFVLQIAGHKKWRVHEPVLDQPLPTESWDTTAEAVRARADESPVIEAVLRPGDCLYLPRGFIHSATALGGTSVHLTFGIHPVIERDVVRSILEVLETSGWRRSMPADWQPGSASGAAQIQAVLDDLAEALNDVDVDAVANLLHDRRAAQQRPEPIAPIAQAEAAASLKPGDAVRLRTHLNARLEAFGADPPTLVASGGRRIPVSVQERPAIERLLAGHTEAIEELPAAGPDDALELARRLLREGVLVPVV
ncbi:MAG: cupin domain-containing protein [Candidatus Nanopelagicales bacterium]